MAAPLPAALPAFAERRAPAAARGLAALRSRWLRCGCGAPPLARARGVGAALPPAASSAAGGPRAAEPLPDALDVVARRRSQVVQRRAHRGRRRSVSSSAELLRAVARKLRLTGGGLHRPGGRRARTRHGTASCAPCPSSSPGERRSLSSPAVPATPLHLRPTAALAERAALLPDDPGRRAGARPGPAGRRPRCSTTAAACGGTRGDRGGRRAADHPEHGPGRPERRGRARGAVRPRAAHRDRRRPRAGPWPSDLALGDLVVANTAVTGDGASAALAGAPSVHADPELATALAEQAEHAGARRVP